MKNIIFIFSLLISFAAYSKSVSMSVNARLSTCSKNTNCILKDSVHEINFELAPLSETGLDYGIGDLTFKSPIQKFGFKAIASSLKTEKNMEIVFLVMNENFQLNTFTVVMNIPESLNTKLRISSPVYNDLKGSTSSVGLEVTRLEVVE